MLQFFLNGGVPMYGVVICAGAALIAAIRFAITPDRRKVGAIVCLSVAALASTFLGFVADVATVCLSIGKTEEWQTPEMMRLVLVQGLGESISPLMLGLALLTVIWLVMAVGHRRLAPRLAA